MAILQLLLQLFGLGKQKVEEIQPVGEKEKEKVLMDLAPKKKIIHINCDGPCPKCEEIFNKFPDKNMELYNWFNQLRLKVKTAHIAYAGRGKEEQNYFYEKKTSKAKWGESPHNYNLAIDIFELTQTGARFDVSWYQSSIIPEAIKAGFDCGGLWKSFKDWPHIEIKNWKQVVKDGKAKLVE